MSNLKFYTFFSIFNILLIIFILIFLYASVYLFNDALWGELPHSNEIFWCGIITYFAYVITKLLFPKIILKISKKYKNSIFNSFLQYLYDNPMKKKKILKLAFCFDLPYIIYLLYLDINTLGVIAIFDTLFYVVIIYFVLYTGGAFTFYLMLYKELKNLNSTIKR